MDTYRQANLTAAEIADLTGEIFAFPDHLATTPWAAWWPATAPSSP